MTRSQQAAAAVTAILLQLAAAAPASAAASATVKAACTADAHRFCEKVIRNAAKRHACMHAHAAQLSEGCIAALRKSRK
jgi:hypothetical protein